MGFTFFAAFALLFGLLVTGIAIFMAVYTFATGHPELQPHLIQRHPGPANRMRRFRHHIQACKRNMNQSDVDSQVGYLGTNQPPKQKEKFNYVPK
ncbi:hypothetical protein ACFV97_30535 [Streptomyces sp. NPDC059913]|uniref:hypothetical protein n=1 Tax=unclassified Streptomyces TaxID=2593676 RepID=UPI00366588D0